MNRKLSLIITALVAAQYTYGQNLVRKDLPLYNVLTDNEITISKFDSHTAVVLIFTSIHCPYAKLYTDRIISMSNEYAEDNVRFVMVNANTLNTASKETLAQMKDVAHDMPKKMPYFADKKKLVKNTLKVQKNPEVIILIPTPDGYQKVYQGAIDDNPQSESQVNTNYVQLALEDLLADETIAIPYQRPVGCMIR